MICHRSSAESRRWLAGPNFEYYPQQLNFAFFCAKTGCGVSQRILFEDKMRDGKNDLTDFELNLPPQVRSFFWFHVYFTVRRILFELGGVQNSLALPGDSAFSQTENKYDIPSFKRICAEFGISPNADFRFTKGDNHGLGSVFKYFTLSGYFKTPSKYPSKTAKFEDEGGRASDGNLVPYIENTEARNQYEYFICPISHGLTSAGLRRINQSIESFCFAILGAQVNVRSSIAGSQGSSIETQREFLGLVEDAIRNPEISKSVQRFQLAIESAKVRLDLAISPGTWLLPSKMDVNTESVVGCNNKLKKATSFMKIGVNSDLNIPVRRSVSKHNFGTGAVNYPTLVLKENILKLAQVKTKLKQRKRGWLKTKKAKQAKQAVVEWRSYSRIFQFPLIINVKISEHAQNFNVFKPRLVCRRILILPSGSSGKSQKSEILKNLKFSKIRNSQKSEILKF